MSDMTKEELFDYIDGFCAWDGGARDSGIYHPEKKKEVLVQLSSMDEREFNKLMAEFIRTKFVSEEAVEQRYGYSDVVAFVEWFEDFLDSDYE